MANSTFPNIKDSIKPFLDIVQSDSVALNNFDQAMLRGDFNKATEYLAQIQNSDQKIFTADKFNLLRDCYIQITKFYQTDIKPYIAQKQIEWQNVINQFSFLSNYSSITQYIKNNMVLYKDKIYLCILTPINTGISPDNKTYWRIFTIQGIQGDSSAEINTVFMFDWNAQTLYKPNMIVYFENQWWISLKDNTGQTPQQGEFWDLILTIQQQQYPIQPIEPTVQVSGDLWFETL